MQIDPIKEKQNYIPRILTAASLFDGHDAAINIIRRLLQGKGCEVIHLGHNRSVAEIVQAAIQEDVDAIAISSYQGGHMEFFRYLVDELKVRERQDIQLFAGGGGVILPAEIAELQEYGVTRIYSADDGQAMGLEGIIDDLLSRVPVRDYKDIDFVFSRPEQLSLAISQLENSAAVRAEFSAQLKQLSDTWSGAVIGLTGTGGAGKSSLCDELLQRLQLGFEGKLKLAVLAVDPSRRKTGGALLGDRIRFNSLEQGKVFFRSMATRLGHGELPDSVPDILNLLKAAEFDLIVLETPGIGQASHLAASLVDLSVYVMTPEYGAATQLEKIDMLDWADLVVINKGDRFGADDALHDVRKQLQRNLNAWEAELSDMPVYKTQASQFNDPGVTRLYQALCEQLDLNPSVQLQAPDKGVASCLPANPNYLSQVVSCIREYKQKAFTQSQLVSQLDKLKAAKAALGPGNHELNALICECEGKVQPETKSILAQWQRTSAEYRAMEGIKTLSGLTVNKVSLPDYWDQGQLCHWLTLENLPGYFPYTAGVFPLKREDEDATRMFAGEGGPQRTNKRFKAVSAHSTAKRLSTAFDSVTLYGFDPELRPDIYGKVGNSGVSVATLDDMKTLYQGFDLCDSQTSVSMTINGPAPVVLAMYLNAAIDQQVELAGSDADIDKITKTSLEKVRGTVQADILKEDQGQNTCIFSTEFSLNLMADVQAYFSQYKVRHFYSVSVSGYHIAEAGANPISQLAFTLANGFTYVESWLARGLNIDEFAPNLSFFFSNGMDPEYAVLGRVARRIWAITLADKYGANSRSQKLKYHIQTSGRSLHAQEVEFNDIRTTLQALIAVYDHCNSLHTNAFDEAITTPTPESVRRALAIQLIINKEWGGAKSQNPNQGAFVLAELTELVEEAVLLEFERLSQRGGVLGAMETGYQRGKIQQESLLYEQQKHSGEIPIVGVNTFVSETPGHPGSLELARSSEQEKQQQIKNLADFQRRHQGQSEAALKALVQVATRGENVFAELMETVKVCSLGQITQTLFSVGGKYRRNM